MIITILIYLAGYIAAYWYMRRHIKKTAGTYTLEDRVINCVAALLSWLLLIVIIMVGAVKKFRKKPIDWSRPVKW
jgi:hypothetical protein